MNFFVFTVVVLIAIQGAYAIRCHQCQPDIGNITIALSTGDISAVNLCNNPTDTFDCSQDPNIGSFADACFTATATLNISLLNIGEITYHVQNCTVKSICPQLKNITCDGLKTTFAGISGVGISYCDISCCEGDLCNKSPATSPSGTPATGYPTSSVKSTHVPPNAAIFGILGWVTVAFMSLF